MKQKSHPLLKTFGVVGALTLSFQSFAEPLLVDLDSPENAAIFAQGGGLAGTLTASLGDVNGDGLDDMIIAGDSSASVVFGAENSADMASSADELSENRGFTVTLDDPSERPFSGNVIGLASGDVDSDGVIDIAISFQIERPEPFVEPLDPCSLSRIACKGHYLTAIVYGKTLQTVSGNLDLSTLDSTQSRHLFGAEPALDGIQMADVDGDGRSDILISTVSDNAFGAVVYSNSATDVDLSELDGSDGFTVVRPTTPNYPDARLLAAGDINGDGNHDIAIAGLIDRELPVSSTFRMAEAAIIFGQQVPMSGSVDITDIDGVNGFNLQPQLGSRSYDYGKLAALGDINADGYDDLGMPVVAGVKTLVLVVLGSNKDYSTNVLTGEDWFAEGSGFVIEIPEDFCQSFPSSTGVCTPFIDPGSLLAGVGDVNDDGIDDVLLGRFGLNLIYGRNTWPTQPYCADGTDDSCCTQALCHQTVSADFIDIGFLPRPVSFPNIGIGRAGDVNGDQVNDMIIPLQGSSRITFGAKDQQTCIDNDGDGWGWDGEKSCQLTATDDCNYNDAADNGGWGWNPVTMQSCEPVNNDDDCVYTAADQNDGWGWNPVTSQSCPPITPTTQCIDTDGDGWGWDGTKSCLTAANDLINLSTGVVVETINLKWTEQELTSAAMVCEDYQWNDSASDYLPVSPKRIKQYNHFYPGVVPAGEAEVPGGWVLNLSENYSDSRQEQVFSWTLENGLYQGAAPIGSSNTIEDDPHGFKVWKSSYEYAQCVGIHSPSEAIEPCLYAGSDTDGDGYGWDDRASCRVTAESEPVREIFHAGTGEQIDLVKLQWTWGDFWQSFFTCTEYNYSGTEYVADENSTEYLHIGATASVYESEIPTTFWLEGGIYNGPAPIDAIAEVTDDGVIRSWVNDNSYHYCSVKPVAQ